MAFKESKLRGKIDGMKMVLSRIKPEKQDSPDAVKIKKAIAEAEEELRRLQQNSK